MADWNTKPSPTQAHAYLGTKGAFHTFRFNPDTVNWAYQENTISMDTIGGRVVQLLSVNVQGLTVEGKAGSRGELQRLAENVRSIMNFHIRTSLPVSFKVPSRRWNFRVYVEAMPQMGWDYSATTYPYSIQLQIVDDLTGIQAKKLERSALSRLITGIGYSPSVHGGDPQGFTKIVKSVTAANGSDAGNGSPASASSSGGGTGYITPAIRQVEAAMDVRFPGWTNGGDHVCKVSTGTDGYWSEHSWGNGVDIMTDQGKYNGQGNTIFNWLMKQFKDGKLPIAQILWQGQDQINGGSVEDHTNHIHVTGNPPQNSRTIMDSSQGLVNTSNTDKPGKKNCPSSSGAW